MQDWAARAKASGALVVLPSSMPWADVLTSQDATQDYPNAALYSYSPFVQLGAITVDVFSGRAPVVRLCMLCTTTTSWSLKITLEHLPLMLLVPFLMKLIQGPKRAIRNQGNSAGCSFGSALQQHQSWPQLYHHLCGHHRSCWGVKLQHGLWLQKYNIRLGAPLRMSRLSSLLHFAPAP